MTLPYLSVVGMLLLNGMFFLAAPHVIMRIFAAKDDYTASQTLNGAMLLNVIGTIFLLVLVAPAVLIVTQGMELQVADRAILVFMDQALPGVFAGIVLGGFASAMMATVDAFVLGLGALVTKDIVDTWRPNTSDKKKTYIARGSIIGIGSLSMLMAFDPPQALILMNAAAASIGAAAFAFPLLLGIWWDRCNKYGAGAGILGGMISAIFLNPVLTGMMPGWTSPLPLFQDVVVALPVSLLLTVAVSLVTPAPPREIVDDITRSRSEVIRTSADD
jgi:sodium/pantothenate symporter